MIRDGSTISPGDTGESTSGLVNGVGVQPQGSHARARRETYTSRPCYVEMSLKIFIAPAYVMGNPYRDVEVHLTRKFRIRSTLGWTGRQ